MTRPKKAPTSAAFQAAAARLAEYLERPGRDYSPELAARLRGFAGAMVGESSHECADRALGARTARELGLALYFAPAAKPWED